jgi:rare lipoprotein A (peptidoglycan hydrolase)
MTLNNKFLLVSIISLFCHYANVLAQAPEEYTTEASVYTYGRYGKKMADGSYLSSRHRTCSHEYLPVGSQIQITNLSNNRSVVLEVNGISVTSPVEITHSVAQELGMLGSQKGMVKVVVLKKGEGTVGTVQTQYKVEEVPIVLTPEEEKRLARRNQIMEGRAPQQRTLTPESRPTTTRRVVVQAIPEPSSSSVPVSSTPVAKEKKRTYEFPMDFPTYEPLKVDTVKGKVIIR